MLSFIKLSLVTLLLSVAACHTGEDTQGSDSSSGSSSDTGDTGDTGDDSTGTSASTSTLTASTMALDLPNITISPSGSQVTITGNAGALMTESGDALDCSGSTLRVTNADTNSMAPLAADCSFSTQIAAASGSTIEISVTDANAQESSPYAFTTPTESSSMQDILLNENETVLFNDLSASTSYTLCQVPDDQTTCADPSSAGVVCTQATSDEDGVINLVAAKGKTYQVLTAEVDPTTGATVCYTEDVLTTEEAAAIDSEFAGYESEAETTVAEQDEQYQQYQSVTSTTPTATTTQNTQNMTAKTSTKALSDPELGDTPPDEVSIAITIGFEGILPDSQETLPPVEDCTNGTATQCQDMGLGYLSDIVLNDDRTVEGNPSTPPVKNYASYGANAYPYKTSFYAVNHSQGPGCVAVSSSTQVTPDATPFDIVISNMGEKFYVGALKDKNGQIVYGKIWLGNLYRVKVSTVTDSPEWWVNGETYCPGSGYLGWSLDASPIYPKLRDDLGGEIDYLYDIFLKPSASVGGVTALKNYSPKKVKFKQGNGYITAKRSTTIEMTIKSGTQSTSPQS